MWYRAIRFWGVRGWGCNWKLCCQIKVLTKLVLHILFTTRRIFVGLSCFQVVPEFWVGRNVSPRHCASRRKRGGRRKRLRRWLSDRCWFCLFEKRRARHFRGRLQYHVRFRGQCRGWPWGRNRGRLRRRKLYRRKLHCGSTGGRMNWRRSRTGWRKGPINHIFTRVSPSPLLILKRDGCCAGACTSAQGKSQSKHRYWHCHYQRNHA